MTIMNPETLTGKVVLGLIRHTIVGVSAAYVNQGLINHDQQETLVAGLMVAVGLAMSIYDKAQQHKGGSNDV